MKPIGTAYENDEEIIITHEGKILHRFAKVQKAPELNEHVHVWNAVINEALHTFLPGRIRDQLTADMQRRHQKGLATYGVPLQPHNGRNAIQDAYEEFLDTCVYLRQAMLEGKTELTHMYQSSMETCYTLCKMLMGL